MIQEFLLLVVLQFIAFGPVNDADKPIEGCSTNAINCKTTNKGIPVIFVKVHIRLGASDTFYTCIRGIIILVSLYAKVTGILTYTDR